MISNPQSSGQSPATVRRVLYAIRAVPGIRLRSVFTHYPGHASRIVAGLTRDDVDVVLVLGGDGTVNEVVNGLLPAAPAAANAGDYPALAVVPAGSANVFSRALGFAPDPASAARELAEGLAAGSFRTVSLGRWDEGWFVVNAGCGVDADVIARMERARSRGRSATPLRYLAVAAQAWLAARRRPPSVDVDARRAGGRPWRARGLPVVFASNTNPWTYLGPLPVVTNPKNSFDRGIGLFAIPETRGQRGIRGLLYLGGLGHDSAARRLLEGAVLTVDDAEAVRLSSVKELPFQVDGELVGTRREMRLCSVPRALEVVVPRRSADDETDPPLDRAWRTTLRRGRAALRMARRGPRDAG